MKKKDIPSLKLPTKILYLPDVPPDGKWDVASRIAGMMYRRYLEVRKNPKKKYTKKEIMIQNQKNQDNESERKLVERATPKQKADAFGLFIDKVLEDTNFQDDFKDALAICKTQAPEKFLDVALKMQKLRHPVEKDVNVNVDVEIRETIYERTQKQYRYSEMIEEAQIEEPKQLEQQQKEIIRQLAFQNEDEQKDDENKYVNDKN